LKLLQARFTNLTPLQWDSVAEEISRLFQSLGEFDLTSISVNAATRSKLDYQGVPTQRLSEILKRSFIASQKVKVDDYSEIVTVKSNRSCRFIVTEDDGLIRICLAADDPAPDFTNIGAEMSDASHLLVETDLFDYI
jgi:hypothetical protein